MNIKQTFLKQRSIYLPFLLLLILLSSCTQKQAVSEEQADLSTIRYLAYYDEPVFGGIDNHFVFLDADGHVVKEEIQRMGNKQDIWYSHLEKPLQQFYMFGDGGLFQIDLAAFKSQEVEIIGTTYNIDFQGTDLIYGCDLEQDTGDDYVTNACRSSDNSHILIESQLYDIYCTEELCYFSEVQGDDFRLVTWDDQGVKKQSVPSLIRDFVTVNGQIYALSEHGMLSVENPSVLIPYVDEAGNETVFYPKVFGVAEGNIYFTSKMSYKASLQEQGVVCEPIPELEGMDIMPSMLENSIVLIEGNVNTGKTVYDYNYVTQEWSEPVKFDLEKFYHVVQVQ